jgi:hypothetical protein
LIFFSYDTQCEYYIKNRKKQGVSKKWNASQTAEEKNTLGKVPSDYTKKIGAGLYEKQNELTLPIFRNAHQFFHIFLIIFNRYPWGISSENKRK